MSSASGPIGPDGLDQVAARKLPHEEEHLAALERMAGLEPYYRWVAELAEALNGGPLGSRILDAGCGIGNFVEIMRHRADEVLAVDLSPRNVAVLQRRGNGIVSAGITKEVSVHLVGCVDLQAPTAVIDAHNRPWVAPRGRSSDARAHGLKDPGAIGSQSIVDCACGLHR